MHGPEFLVKFICRYVRSNAIIALKTNIKMFNSVSHIHIREKS